jgi:hypothetical protein
MMKDRLEQFISDNRDQFDVHEPDDRLWAGIESSISGKKVLRISWKAVLWRAAAVILIFAASFGVQEILHQRKAMVAGQEEKEIMQRIPELQEAEMYYTGLLNEKISQIEPLIRENPELGESIQQDLSELDSIYTELQKDLRDNIANDEVVEAMIQNYMMKIQILEDLLEYMEESSKTNEDEKAAFEI